MKNKSFPRFSEDIYLLRDFIQEDPALSTFLHCTSSLLLAQQIMNEGLAFESHLTHTSDSVSGTDLIELNYFRIIRKPYGYYTIVIQIDTKLVMDFSHKMQNTPYHFSEALSKYSSQGESDEAPVYRLPEQFIRGYFDHIQNQGVRNPRFDPYYYPAYFNHNLDHLLRQNHS